MAQLHPDLREFVELLLANEVEFLVVGSHAVAFHGYPRYTQDIDFLVRPTAENSERLTLMIQQFGFESLGLSPKDFQDPDVVVQLGYPPNRVDLLTGIDGVSFDEAWDSRVRGDLDGLPVEFIGRESLIKNKRSTGRAKDLGDVEELERS